MTELGEISSIASKQKISCDLGMKQNILYAVCQGDAANQKSDARLSSWKFWHSFYSSKCKGHSILPNKNQVQIMQFT